MGVVVVTFLLSHALPGDPAVLFAGLAANADSVAQVRAHLGLDRSLLMQFLGYVGEMAHGNLGQSFTTGQPVLADFVQRLPASLERTAAAILFAVAVAMPIGVLAATREGSFADHLCRSTVTVAFPTFFVALLLVYVLYYLLRIAPKAKVGFHSNWHDARPVFWSREFAVSAASIGAETAACSHTSQEILAGLVA